MRDPSYVVVLEREYSTSDSINTGTYAIQAFESLSKGDIRHHHVIFKIRRYSCDFHDIRSVLARY